MSRTKKYSWPADLPPAYQKFFEAFEKYPPEVQIAM